MTKFAAFMTVLAVALAAYSTVAAMLAATTLDARILTAVAIVSPLMALLWGNCYRAERLAAHREQDGGAP